MTILDGGGVVTEVFLGSVDDYEGCDGGIELEGISVEG